MLAALLAFLVAAVTAGLVTSLRILDLPNDRSSHDNPTPRGAGAGILTGFLAGLALVLPDAPSSVALLVGVGSAGLIAGVLGFFDDLYTLSEKLKFVVLTGLALALAVLTGPVQDLGIPVPWLVGLIGSALWVFTVANAVNFMDGSDGIMAACLIPASLALAVMAPAHLAPACYVLAAATAGFAIFNAPIGAPRGQAFSGDVGSLSLSVLFAGLTLIWVMSAPSGSVWLAPLLILPFLGDVLLTMASRAKAGRRLFSAHRAHAYQLLIRMGDSHRKIALIWGGMSLACGALALIGHALPAGGKLAIFVVAVAGFTLYHRKVRARAKAAGQDVTQ